MTSIPIPPERKRLLERVLSIYHPRWAGLLHDMGRRARQEELVPLTEYLERVLGALELFVPATRPDFGITERGGDAVVCYIGDKKAGRLRFFLMLDVSGFTAILTFLTDHFGKQEAGDIMNLGILNRYCLNRIGVLLHHFAFESTSEPGCEGQIALKTALGFRALLGQVTREVRAELARKLGGKPNQQRIRAFIKSLEIKASGGLIAAPAGGGSHFYGTSQQARITWGETARLVSVAEKLGGSDDLTGGAAGAECKGIGLDDPALSALEGLCDTGWCRHSDFVLKSFGSLHKLVLTPAGRRRISRKVEHLFESGGSPRAGKSGTGPELAPDSRVQRAAIHLEKLVPYLYGEDLIEMAVRRLGPEGDKWLLFDERSSRIHDTGILFINFTVDREKLLDELAETVHGIMLQYGMVYKYNIFPQGDFNLMAALGLELPGAPETDLFYTEVLWQCWKDLLREVKKKFGSQVSLRAGMSVGTCLQGPVGDNLIHNEHTVIGPDCNLAARLLAQALEKEAGHFIFENGAMVVTPGCYKRLAHLVQPAGPYASVKLKGFSKAVPLYNLISRQANEQVADYCNRFRQLPLVTASGKVVDSLDRMGRDSILRSCLEVLGPVDRERDRWACGTEVIALYGPGGLGKTRRMAELMAWCEGRGWPVLFGGCYSWYQGGGGTGKKRPGRGCESAAAVPFHPFIRIMVEQVFGITGQHAPEEALGKIREGLSRLRGGLGAVKHAPIAASFLGLEHDERDIESLNPKARRNIFFELVAESV
ncbi:MAG: hypothetical protein U9P14_08260, partial [Gemmatimonadota bacterium]|nr:hypothetical protein [Gemmatimonadota bacterium]